MLENNKKRGIGLVEVIIAIAIIVGATLATFVFFSLATKVARQSAETVQAALLMEEGLEATRVIRDEGYVSELGTLSNNTSYYLFFEENTWSATTTASLIDGIFTRTLTLEEVRRDASDDITLVGGSLDSDTREATVRVSWLDEAGSTKELEASTYLANVFEE